MLNEKACPRLWDLIITCIPTWAEHLGIFNPCSTHLNVSNHHLRARHVGGSSRKAAGAAICLPAWVWLRLPQLRPVLGRVSLAWGETTAPADSPDLGSAFLCAAVIYTSLKHRPALLNSLATSSDSSFAEFPQKTVNIRNKVCPLGFILLGHQRSLISTGNNSAPLV